MKEKGVEENEEEEEDEEEEEEEEGGGGGGRGREREDVLNINKKLFKMCSLYQPGWSFLTTSQTQ